jgi:hypothetical protein
VTPVIEGVRYKQVVEPAELQTFVRSASTRGTGNTPFLSAIGQPPSFRGARQFPGDYTERVAGLQVTKGCKQAQSLSGSFVELVTSMKASQAGGLISVVYLDYRVKSKPYTLKLNWTMVVCGDNRTVARYCRS